MAFALVAKLRQTRPAQTRVLVTRHAGSNPAERTHAPLAQLEEALDLGSRCWGFASLAGHNGSLVKSRITLGFYP